MTLSGEIKNARIERTMLGTEDHGIFTSMLYVDYGGSGQGIGGYCLDTYIGERGKGMRVGTRMGMAFIMRILEVVGVDSWERLIGAYIRVRSSHEKVYAIGNLLREDWLVFESFFSSFDKQSINRGD